VCENEAIHNSLEEIEIPVKAKKLGSEMAVAKTRTHNGSDYLYRK
jgi:hypothetical protein